MAAHVRATVLVAAAATAVALVSACTVPPKGPADAVEACQQHFKTVTVAEWSTAGVVRHEGAPANYVPGPLAKYPASERVALCLVPDGHGENAATAVVVRTGEIDQRWTQSDDRTFTPPI